MKIHLRTEDSDGGVLSADLDHLVTLAAGENELGDVVVHQPAVVLSGTVKDQLGAPIYWACVDIARKEVQGEGPDQWTWQWVGGLRAMTDKQGSFVCTGSLEPGDYGYNVRSQEHVDAKIIPFLPGTKGLEVVLAQYGRLEGSLLLPDGVSTASIVLDARAEGQPWEPWNWINQQHHPLPTGEFLMEKAPPGRIDVRFRLDAESEPIVSVMGVTIEPGQTNRDPRLQKIDLRASLYPYELDLYGAAGETVPEAQVAFSPSGDASVVPRRLATIDGNLTLLSPWPVIDLEVMARGFRTIRAAEVRGDRRIELEAGIPVRVQLADGVDLPDPPRELAVVLIPALLYRPSFEAYVYSESDGQRIQMISLVRQEEVLAERELLCYLPDPGEYLVYWAILDASPDAPERRIDLNSTPGQSTIRVEEGAGIASFVLAPDEDELRAALDR